MSHSTIQTQIQENDARADCPEKARSVLHLFVQPAADRAVFNKSVRKLKSLFFKLCW